MLLDHPATGVGAGEFTDEFRDNTSEWRFRISQGHAHNAYLQVAAETGVAGLAAYLALLSAIVWSLIERARFLPDRWRGWAALAVTVAIGIHGLFDYLHVLSLGIVLSAIWAYGLAGSPRGVALGEHNSTF
jgi:O-antigen ligase